MPKSSKRFVIVSNQVNNYGYRYDTKGVDLTQFNKNPVLLYMHQRGNVIGHWQDVKLEDNGDITGVPFFSDGKEDAMTYYKQVEEGSLRMCSSGILPHEASDDALLKMPKQTLPTIIKSELKEASIVDIGGDNNSLALYQTNGEILVLNDGVDPAKILQVINQNNKIEMKEHLLPLLTLVGLKSDGSMEQLIQKINDLKTNADNANALLQQRDDTIVTLNDTIATLQQAATTAAVDAVIDAAVAERKITEAQKPFYKQMGETNLENLKQLMATMPATPTLASHINTTDAADPLLKLSYEEAHKTGKLAEIKGKYPEQYKQIFKAKFGKEPQA
jgi:hypothetical protein